MRQINSCDSCNTLIDVNFINDVSYNCCDNGGELACEVRPYHEDIEGGGVTKTDIQLVDGSPLMLPNDYDEIIDNYLQSIPCIENASTKLLSRNLVRLDGSDGRKYLNVYQGEVAHVHINEKDQNQGTNRILVSDDATTCHILIVRSEHLCSMAHIDRPGHDECLKEVFDKHDGGKITVHLMGGYNDDGTSRELTSDLIKIITDLASRCKSRNQQVTLATAAVCRMNDDGYCNPIGRGLAVDVLSGEIALAEISGSAAGPALVLRSARLWATHEDNHKLTVITDNDNSHDVLKVAPFVFLPFPDLDGLMDLPDDVLLQYTSTSPEVEKPQFCSNLRATLAFLRDEQWSSYFGKDCNQALVYKRIRNSNSWELHLQPSC